MHEVIKEERQKFTDQLLSEIATEVGRLYELVHPDEGYDQIQLSLNDNRRASLDIETKFLGKETAPPQAYLSQSHLDTLGMCVFLALALKDQPENKILILDDVLGSMDEPHVDRLVKMLYDEAKKFKHCILTTHYKPWQQKLRWGYLNDNQCQMVELSAWSSTEGLIHIKSIPDVTRLRLLLDETPIDCQLVCAKAGYILEAILDFLTEIYECDVPRRRANYWTLGDLLPSIDRKLKPALIVHVAQFNPENPEIQYQEISIGNIIGELQEFFQARNLIGAHFNKAAFNLPDGDTRKFGELVLALSETLICQESGWPRSQKSGSYWATQGETRRLHPLKRPA